MVHSSQFLCDLFPNLVVTREVRDLSSSKQPCAANSAFHNSMFKLPLLLLALTSLPFIASAFVSASSSRLAGLNLNKNLKSTSWSPGSLEMSESSSKNNNNEAVCPHPFSQLPGDPSLLLVTNIDLGDKKLDIMKECSKAISTATGKPESYIGMLSSTSWLRQERKWNA